MTTHLCAAIGCEKRVARQRLMCLAHWQMVPMRIQREIWRLYRADAIGTTSYEVAVGQAIEAVRQREADTVGTR